MNQGPFGPWNPGLRSPLPSALLPQVTVFRPEHVSTGLARARELQDLTGLPLEALVCFRPRRLAVHELLVRVTADFTVEDGARSEDLGINFRRLAEILLARHLDPRMAEIERAHATLREALQARIDEELRTHLDGPTPKKRGFGGFPGRGVAIAVNLGPFQQRVGIAQPVELALRVEMVVHAVDLAASPWSRRDADGAGRRHADPGLHPSAGAPRRTALRAARPDHDSKSRNL